MAPPTSTEEAFDGSHMIHLHVGTSGSGKTFGLKEGIFADADRGIPFLILECREDWTGAPARFRPAPYTDVNAAIRDLQSGATRFAVVRPVGDPIAAWDRACEWACRTPGPCGVACAEAHEVMPNKRIHPKWTTRAITQWRHYGIEMWIDTQRFAELWTTAVSQAVYDTKIYATVGPADLKMMQSLWGYEIVRAADECAARLAAGQPGWYVKMGLVRRPPFQIHRDVVTG